MKVTQEGCRVSAQHLAAMRDGLEVMGSADAEVVVTDDFEAAVRRVANLSSYSAARGSGVAAAKTIPTPHGAVIIINAPRVLTADTATVERLLAHEAGHVLLSALSELTGGRRHLVHHEWQWIMLCLGGLAMEEYRIERKLCDLGYPAASMASPGSLDEALHVANVDVMGAVVDPVSGQRPTHLMDSVLAVADRLAKLLAYQAAATLSCGIPFNLTGLSRAGQVHWEDYVADTWGLRLSLYQGLLSADVPMGQLPWEQALVDALELELVFLEKIGFYFSTDDGSDGFWRVQDDLLFDRRWNRATVELDQRGMI